MAHGHTGDCVEYAMPKPQRPWRHRPQRGRGPRRCPARQGHNAEGAGIPAPLVDTDHEGSRARILHARLQPLLEAARKPPLTPDGPVVADVKETGDQRALTTVRYSATAALMLSGSSCQSTKACSWELRPDRIHSDSNQDVSA